MKWSRGNLIWLVAYVAVMVAVTVGMLTARRYLMAIYGTSSAQKEWDTWRTDAKDMALGAGPVKRREPQSPEPPALVLMRDHFAACLGLSLLLSTVLFGTFMIFLRGALSDASQKRAWDDASRRRGRDNASAKRR